MKKLFLAMLFFVCTAAAMPVNITFNKDNNTYYMQGESYSITVTVKNIGTSSDNYTITVRTNGKDVLVNNTNKQTYTITNLAANASNSKTVTIKINKSMEFNKESWFEVTVTDSNSTNYESNLVIQTPGFTKIIPELVYNPQENEERATLKITGKTSNDETTTRYNTTYFVYKRGTTEQCYNGTKISEAKADKYEITLYFDNCSTGPHDIYVEATADDTTRTKKIHDVFLFKGINFTAEFFRKEDFGYERELNVSSDNVIKAPDRIASGDQLIIKCKAVYTDGTALSHSGYDPDSYVKLFIEDYYNKTSDYEAIKEIGNDGTVLFLVNAPVIQRNDSDDYTGKQNYKLTLTAYSVTKHAKNNYTKKNEYTFTVNNLKEYEYKPINVSELLSNINLTLPNNSITMNASGTAITLRVKNNNINAVTGHVKLDPTGDGLQFNVQATINDVLLGNKEKNYTFIVTPKNYTRPGTYNVSAIFNMRYGKASVPLAITIPNEPLKNGEMNVFRYVNYSNNSKVSLKLVNLLPADANVTVREFISKKITLTLKTIDDLLKKCQPENFTCRLNYVITNGSCSDCIKVSTNSSDNYTKACEDACINRTFVSFNPEYTRIIQDDPVIEWDTIVPKNATKELSYYTGMMVDESWFVQPNITLSVIPAPTPTVTVSPTLEPSIEPTPEPTLLPQPGSKNVSSGILSALGVVFFLVVLCGIVIAGLFIMKRKEIEEFLNKYAPIEEEETEEQKMRKRIRSMFITEEELKKQEQTKEDANKKSNYNDTNTTSVKKENEKSFINKLNEFFSPKKKEEKSQAKSTPKSSKPQKKDETAMMDSLMEIGKGFGEK